MTWKNIYMLENTIYVWFLAYLRYAMYKLHYIYFSSKNNNAWNLVQTLANAPTFNWASLNDPIKMFFSFEIDRVAPPLFLLVSFTNLKNAWDVNWAENKNFSVKISIFYFLLYYQRAYNLNRGKTFFVVRI